MTAPHDNDTINQAVRAEEPDDGDGLFSGFVVGIGASAGGLDALERLFDALPPDTGAAFVVVQHLSPDHKSMMDNLLSRHTRMPVRVAEHGGSLQPNHVVLIPPGKTMHLEGDRLQLAPKPEHGLSLPIDIFFSSLAEHFGERSIGVILSGTGSDGSRGIVSINANGGFVFAQDPTNARFDGMPRSAIATGMVDAVATADKLAQRIVSQLRAPRIAADPSAAHGEAPVYAQPLDGVLERLLAASGIDFREYKETTVLRRIERRMQVMHARSVAEYLDRLGASVEEQTLLRRELLIPVTRFFRNADAWEALSVSVIDPLVSRHSGAEPLRAWVACCATGEEAYTVAMLFTDAFLRHGRRPAIKVFATDIEQQYLDQAAAGWYPATIAAEVSAPWLDRWFTQRDGGYAIRTELRQSVIFARHNLLADPPFTRMDFVSCRNALIYFQHGPQERALRRLQYALNVGGTLMLGPSESLGELQRDFTPMNARHKLYRLQNRDRAALGVSSAGHAAAPLRRSVAPAPTSPRPTPVESGLRALAQRYVPPTLLLGEHRELLHVYGDAGGLLQIAEGQASLDVLKLLPRELSWAAALVLRAVRLQGGEQRSPTLVGPAPIGRPLQLVARALEDERPGEIPRQVLLSFESAEAGNPPTLSDSQLDNRIEQQRQVEALERELSRTHDSLRTTIEELETANEELQATNEELTASNEELQSTNEELQSVNEELYTVNTEYQEKVDILNSVNADLENVSKATAIPTIFVDEGLHLVRFTPQASQLFKLREGDAGRPLDDFAHTLDYPELFADLRRTLASGTPVEREARDRTGRWWLARIQPYSDRAHAAPRAVMTFVDLTSVKDQQRLQAIVDSMADQLAVLDAVGRIVLVNDAWRRFAAANGDEGMVGTGPGVNYLAICAAAADRDEDARKAYDGLDAVLEGRSKGFSMQYPCHSPTGRHWFLMRASPVSWPDGGAVVSHYEITDWIEGLGQGLDHDNNDPDGRSPA